MKGQFLVRFMDQTPLAWTNMQMQLLAAKIQIYTANSNIFQLAGHSQSLTYF